MRVRWRARECACVPRAGGRAALGGGGGRAREGWRAVCFCCPPRCFSSISHLFFFVRATPADRAGGRRRRGEGRGGAGGAARVVRERRERGLRGACLPLSRSLSPHSLFHLPPLLPFPSPHHAGRLHPGDRRPARGDGRSARSLRPGRRGGQARALDLARAGAQAREAGAACGVGREREGLCRRTPQGKPPRHPHPARGPVGRSPPGLSLGGRGPGRQGPVGGGRRPRMSPPPGAPASLFFFFPRLPLTPTAAYTHSPSSSTCRPRPSGWPPPCRPRRMHGWPSTVPARRCAGMTR